MQITTEKVNLFLQLQVEKNPLKIQNCMQITTPEG